MNTQTITTFFKGVGKAAAKHSPEILAGIGIVGMLTTTVLAVKATPKALEKIDDAKVGKINDQLDAGVKSDKVVEELTKVETVKAAWKPYVPAAVTGVVSIACLIGANSVHLKRNAALAAAYQLSATAFNEYKDKVVETIGEKKEKAIRDKIAEDKVNSDRATTAPVYVVDTNATEFYDPIGGAKFVTTVEKVDAAINAVNATLLDNDYVSLNDFYEELGLPPTKMGYDLGWNTHKGRRESLIRKHYAADLINNKSVTVLVFDVEPKYDFDKCFA